MLCHIELDTAGNALGLLLHLVWRRRLRYFANAVVVDGSGNMYLGSQTNSVNLPLLGAIESANTRGGVG